MHRTRSLLAPLALAAVLAAPAGCSQPTATEAAQADPASAGTNAATAVDAGDAGDDAPGQTQTAASGFVLDMDKVDAYYATIVKMARMAQSDPSVAADNDGDGEEDDPAAMDASESVDEYIARIEADPRAERLVTSAGMTVSDFAHTNAALVEGMMAAGMMEASGKTEVPDGINAQYVEFAREHKDELAKKLEAMQAQLGGE